MAGYATINEGLAPSKVQFAKQQTLVEDTIRALGRDLPHVMFCVSRLRKYGQPLGTGATVCCDGKIL